MLQRISKFLSEETRLLVFKSFIRSNFNNCPIIWHFCSKVNTEKLEKLQYRCLKIVFDCYGSSYEELLTRANLPALHLGRPRTIVLKTTKCINNSAPKYIRDLVNLKQSSYSFGYENTLQIPTVRTVTYKQNPLAWCVTASLMNWEKFQLSRTSRGLSALGLAQNATVLYATINLLL